MSSPYPEGRTSAWLKIKLGKDIDAVVGGWTDPRGSREHFGALLLGLYENGELKYIGSVGTEISHSGAKAFVVATPRIEGNDITVRRAALDS